MTAIRYIPAARYGVALIAFFIVTVLPHSARAGVAEKLAEGDKALVTGDRAGAEKAYTEALSQEPENYRILKSLAEVKVALGKFSEAKPLAEKILAKEVTTQKKVKVFRKGESDPLLAELVDETVVTPDFGRNNMRNYLDGQAPPPVPHYRLFFLKAGEMKLVPKNRVRIEYVGVPRLVHEEVLELYGRIQIKLMEASGGAGPGEMVEIKGGCFMMGSNRGSPIEGPVHEVCVSPFKMDKYEVSQKSFQSVVGTNPSRFVAPDLPVESVTWQEAREFCSKAGKRLPTEAEWEFAARGGTTTEFYWGDAFDPSRGNFCDANCDLNIRLADASDGYQHTAPGGRFPPNPLGLHDMAGNVAEWVADWFGGENYYVTSPKDNPVGPVRTNSETLRGGTNDKIFRGGSWESGPETLRSAWRKALLTDYRIESLGFRCAADKQ